jgi:hypothetical protein
MLGEEGMATKTGVASRISASARTDGSVGPIQMIRGAEFSADRSMRFTLLRDWKYELFEPVAGIMNIIGLNPSDAGETQDPEVPRVELSHPR